MVASHELPFLNVTATGLRFAHISGIVSVVNIGIQGHELGLYISN